MRPEHHEARQAVLTLLSLPEDTNDFDLFWGAYRHFHQPAQPHICEGYARKGLEEYEKGEDLPYWFRRVRDEAVRLGIGS